MAYLSESKLREAYHSRLMESYYRSNITDNASYASKTVFLSHSHKDRELILGLQRYLARIGVRLYIDWQDSNMPRITGKETAERIKDRISRLEYFFILASKNAMLSRWVPWEIGVADSKKLNEKIFLIPVVDDNGEFHGNEYLQLYQTLELEGETLKGFKANSRITKPIFG